MRAAGGLFVPGRNLVARCVAGVVALLSAVPAQAQDAAAGEKVFKANCSICHSVQPGRNLVGPSLFGVVSRPSGQVTGYHYSDANRKSGLTWDVATLDHYLTAPSQLVPGTRMTFPGVKNLQQRADLIAYVATVH